MKTPAVQQAQFDWLQERFQDPNFVGIVLSGSGTFFPLEILREIKNGEELDKLFYPKAFPLIPVNKVVDKSLGILPEKE